MIHPSHYSRLLLLAKRMYGNSIDIPALLDKKPSFLDKIHLDVILELLKDDTPFSNKFWETYALCTVGSTKINSVPNIKHLGKLLEMVEENHNKNNNQESLDLLSSTLKFFESNSLLYNSSQGLIESQLDIQLHNWIVENISEEFKEESVNKGKEELLRAILLYYGISDGENNSLFYKEEDDPEEEHINIFKKYNLIEFKEENYKNSKYIHFDKPDMNDPLSPMDFSFQLRKGSSTIKMFRNRIAYVRVSLRGHFIDDFAEIWRNHIKNEGANYHSLSVYELILNCLDYLEACLEAKSNLYAGREIDSTIHKIKANIGDDEKFVMPLEGIERSLSMKEICLVAGLKNVKSLGNDILNQDSLLKLHPDYRGEITQSSALEWLTDKKRKKANFYTNLYHPQKVSLNDLQDIYKSN